MADARAARKFITDILRHAAIFAGGILICRLLVPFQLEGGDTGTYLNPIYGSTMTTRDLVFHTREPGCVWSFQLAYALVGRDAPEWREGVIRAFTWMSVVSGGVFAVLASAFARVVASTPWRRVGAFALVLGGAYVFLFFGHREMYAPFVASMMGFYLCAALHSNARCGIGTVWAAFALAATMHRVALVFLPAMWWLLPAPPSGRWRRPTAPWMTGALLAIIFLALTAVAFQLMYMFRGTLAMKLLPQVIVMETYNWLPELLTPLTKAQMDYVRANSQLGSFHLFTLGSRDHLRHVAFFILTGAPAGVALAAARIRLMRGQLCQFLAACSLCGWVWVVLWHPHRSYHDWDLFAQTGLAVNALAAVLLFGRTGITEARIPSALSPDASRPTGPPGS
jgi:hypothetical protein